MEQVRLAEATKQWLDIGSEEIAMEMEVQEFIHLAPRLKENRHLSDWLPNLVRSPTTPPNSITKRTRLKLPSQPPARLSYNSAKMSGRTASRTCW